MLEPSDSDEDLYDADCSARLSQLLGLSSSSLQFIGVLVCLLFTKHNSAKGGSKTPLTRVYVSNMYLQSTEHLSVP